MRKKERGRGGGRRRRENSSMLVHPQMAELPGQSQGLGATSESPMWARVLAPSSATFPGARVVSWIRLKLISIRVEY